MTNQLPLWPEPKAIPRLRWSISRDKRLRDCARKYYLYHYGSAGGRKAAPDSPVREAYVLKHLRNRYMWVGEVVHELIELTINAWRRKQDVPIDALIDRGTRRMRADYAESRQGIYRERPAVACGLVEHEYDEPVTRAEWQAARDRMEVCIRTFFALPLSQAIRQTPPWQWLAVETMASFEQDGATILVKPDFAWRQDDGRIVLVDWKTGIARADERVQLAVYGVYAEQVWGLSPRGMEAQLVYLQTGEVDTFPLDAGERASAQVAVSQSVTRMQALAEVAQEAPPDEAPALADFARTDDLTQCARCAFRRLCGRDAL